MQNAANVQVPAAVAGHVLHVARDRKLRRARSRGTQRYDLQKLAIQEIDAIVDVQPLRGMQLKSLRLWGTSVSDLTPLAGMPLEDLTINRVPVKDLSPLAGMPIESLEIIDCRQLTDLTPLRGLNLLKLALVRLPITDLTPLSGTDLHEFHTSSKEQLTEASLNLIEQWRRAGCKVTEE